MRGVVDRLRDAGAHAGGAAEHAVEPGVVDHLEDRPDAGALLADQPGRGAVELDLARGVGAVAELVLEPLQAEAVALPSGVQRGRGSTRAAGGLGEHEEGVAHRRRQNHLCPASSYSRRAAALTGRRDGRVGADVGAALLLGHPHPDQGAAPCSAPAVARVIGGGEEARHPLGGELGLRAERRHHRVRHRDRAADPGLDLDQHMRRRRATWAPGRGSAQGEACSPADRRAISACQAGWNSTSSTRSP